MFFLPYFLLPRGPGDATDPFGLSYFSVAPEDEAVRLTADDLPEALLAALDDTASPGLVFEGTEEDDVLMGTDAGEAISGGAGADIIVGDGMSLADLHAMGLLTDAEFDALSLPVDPIGDMV